MRKLKMAAKKAAAAEGLGRTRSLDKSKGRLGRSWTETEMDYNPAEGYSQAVSDAVHGCLESNAVV